MANAGPPRLAAALLERLLPRGDLGDSILGDLHESFVERAARPGMGGRGSRTSAAMWYWSQVPRVGGRYLVRRLVRRRPGASPWPQPTRSRSSATGGTARDVRFALRSMRRNPGFTTATLLVLGIGIGAISLMFSTYNTVVLQPLPFPEPDRLVWVWEIVPGGGQNTISYDDYVDYRDGTESLESLGAFGVFSQGWLLTGTGEAQAVTGSYVSANLFSTLGVEPSLGRSFLEEEERRGVIDAVILSHGLWVSRFGADSTLVGRTISVEGQPVVVAGVMPAAFDFPAGTDVWAPLQQSAGYASGRGNNNFRAVGRLRSGASLRQAQQQMDVIAANIATAWPDAKAGWGVRLQRLHDVFYGGASRTILLLMGIIALVPLVACANVASLLMARSLARRTEIASRLALGAPRSKLVRQLLTESFVMAFGGALIGLALAFAGGEVLRRLAPAALPRLDDIGVDANVMLFTLAAALLTVPLIGVMPALRATDMDVAATLKSGGERGAGGRFTARSALVIAQVALSVMLLLASGLLLRGYLSLQAEDPGFRAQGLVVSRVALPAFKYGTREQVELTWGELFRRTRSIPGVVATGAIDRTPPGGNGPTNEVWSSRRPPATGADKRAAVRRVVSGNLFETLGLAVRQGRVFGPEDRQAGAPVVVINEALARQFFPDEDPVGQTLVLELAAPTDLLILGVVADVKELGPGTTPLPVFYLPAWWMPRLDMDVLVRTNGEPLAIAGAWREALLTVEPDIPDVPIQTMEKRLSASLFQPKFRSALVVAFAIVSLVLSAIGLYGVLAYFVRRNGHDLGIRLALGAPGGEAARLVMTRGLRLAAWGFLIGLPAGIAAMRFVLARGWISDIDLSDPLAYAGVSFSLVLVTVVACAVPALRALRLDPRDVIRAE
jgi:putative ABC transport system permease protein